VPADIYPSFRARNAPKRIRFRPVRASTLCEARKPQFPVPSSGCRRFGSIHVGKGRRCDTTQRPTGDMQRNVGSWQRRCPTNTGPRCLPWRSLGSNWHRRPSAQERASNELSQTVRCSSANTSGRRPRIFERKMNGADGVKLSLGGRQRRRFPLRGGGTILGSAQFIMRRRASPSTPARRWAPVASHLVSAAGARAAPQKKLEAIPDRFLHKKSAPCGGAELQLHAGISSSTS
jgi:hypothetical protein